MKKADSGQRVKTMGNEKKEPDKTDQSSARTGKYLRVNPGISPQLLANYDLFKKATLKGDEYYVLFHRKGTALEAEMPDDLYVLESDLHELLETSTGAKISGKSRPAGKEAVLLITDQYESKILDNYELELQEKIVLTVHCASQVIKNFFGKGVLAKDDFEVIRNVAHNFISFTDLLLEDNQGVSLLLGELIGCDYQVFTHSVHVSLYSGILACELKEHKMYDFDRKRLENLFIGTLLHDIGKILIDPEIRLKKTPLSPEEFQEIKKHPLYGQELVSHAGLSEESLDIILHHHEKWNGGGYPHGLSYQQITPFARIACISDGFDALTSKREYRNAFKPFEALTLMKKKMIGKFYQPYLDIFIQFLGRGTRY